MAKNITYFNNNYLCTLEYIKDEFPFEPHFQFIPDMDKNMLDVCFSILSYENTELVQSLFERYDELYGKMFNKYSDNFVESYSWSLQHDKILQPIIKEYGHMSLIETKKELNMNSINDAIGTDSIVLFTNTMKTVFNNYIMNDETFISRLNIILHDIETEFYIRLYLLLKRLAASDFYLNTINNYKEKIDGSSVLIDTPYASTYIYSNGGMINEWYKWDKENL